MAVLPRLDNPQRRNAEQELEAVRGWHRMFAWWPVHVWTPADWDSKTWGALERRRRWMTNVARRYPKARLRWEGRWIVVKGDPVYADIGQCWRVPNGDDAQIRNSMFVSTEPRGRTARRAHERRMRR